VHVAETTRERLQREAPDLVYVDPREVRGRQAKTSLWRLTGDGAGPARAASGY
jgi:class 3 adenylate cyclase